MANEGRRSVGIRPEYNDVLETVYDTDVFEYKYDIGRFAVAVAIKNGVEPIEEEAGGETVWNVGSFDPEGEVRDMIMAVYPSVDDSLRAAQYLLNEGLSIIQESIDDHREFVLDDFIDVAE